MKFVIALGGNAMTAPDGSAAPDDQEQALRTAVGPIADLLHAGHQVLITHGNGPQVGNLLVKNEVAAPVVPPVPLDWCGAQTQATIGLLLMNALDEALRKRASAIRTVALVSRTLVRAGDPRLLSPSKPVGRYLSPAEAAVMIERGQTWEDRGERGWRRVVASPEPVDCLDLPAASALLDAGYAVVASGGGGIPVMLDDDGRIRGVEAVIDKDLTAALVATSLQADRLIILTDVAEVMLAWGTDYQASLRRVTVSEMRAHAEAGEFASGSMGPKVEAACRYAERTGSAAVITALALLHEALNGTRGTAVCPG